MINDIHPHVLDTAYRRPADIKSEDYILCYKDNTILLKTTGDNYQIPRLSDFHNTIPVTGVTYLFALDSCGCFLAANPPSVDETMVYHEIISLRNLKSNEYAWIGVLGSQLMNWYDTNKFCGKCGSKTGMKDDERAILCPVCGTIVYPKITPAIIVAITCRDKILLARGTHYSGSFYALIAGFVDIGESLEEAVRREVKEEIGIDIQNIRYYKSQPWPFSGSLMIGYFAEADDTQPIIINENEIETAGWFERGNLPSRAPNISISGDMIDAFENNTF